MWWENQSSPRQPFSLARLFHHRIEVLTRQAFAPRSLPFFCISPPALPLSLSLLCGEGFNGLLLGDLAKRLGRIRSLGQRPIQGLPHPPPHRYQRNRCGFSPANLEGVKWVRGTNSSDSRVAMESEEFSADSYVCAEDEVMPRKSKGGSEKANEGKRKRRFSDEQIKSLECTFEAQTKLEPQKKLQLARELGLQPRQVAIWFQNKRARWKSKQLEREYGALRAEYDALLSSFESLEKEKNSLAKQLQKLAELPAGASSSDGGDSDRVGTQGEEERKPSWVSTEGSDLTLMICSAEGEHTLGPRHHYEERKVPDHFCVASEPVVDGPLQGADLGAATRQCCFDAGGGSFSDQSCASSSDWWEFWPLNE